MEDEAWIGPCRPRRSLEDRIKARADLMALIELGLAQLERGEARSREGS